MQSDDEKMDDYISVSRWFLSVCWIHVPLAGIIYALVLAISKKTPSSKRAFAKAYILYRVLVWILALTAIFVIYRVGIHFIDDILSFID